MKEYSILVIVEAVIDLLVPDHSTVCGRDINEFEPKGMTNEVIGDDCSAL